MLIFRYYLSIAYQKSSYCKGQGEVAFVSLALSRAASEHGRVKLSANDSGSFLRAQSTNARSTSALRALERQRTPSSH